MARASISLSRRKMSWSIWTCLPMLWMNLRTARSRCQRTVRMCYKRAILRSGAVDADHSSCWQCYVHASHSHRQVVFRRVHQRLKECRRQRAWWLRLAPLALHQQQPQALKVRPDTLFTPFILQMWSMCTVEYVQYVVYVCCSRVCCGLYFDCCCFLFVG